MMNAILFLISQAITLFGSTVVQMAIVWYITVQTLSGEWVALCSICAYLPQFIVFPLIQPLVPLPSFPHSDSISLATMPLSS